MQKLQKKLLERIIPLSRLNVTRCGWKKTILIGERRVTMLDLKMGIGIILFCLFIASAQGEKINLQQTAINDAKNFSKEAAIKYIECYALDEDKKSLCIAPLAQKYINPKWNFNELYMREFRFSMEKLGFYYFTLQNNKQCDYLNEAPLFIKNENAYLLKCGPKQNYFLRFDYDQKYWEIFP